MSQTTLYLATGNLHKVGEIAAILASRGIPWPVRSTKDFSTTPTWEENGQTFEDNARIKAETVRMRMLEEGLRGLVLADDSGLCVDALNGAPGVYSSRYSGEAATDQLNNQKLLGELKDCPYAQRGAEFRCVLVFLDEHGRHSSFTGRCRGRILEHPRGTGGFGYDPLFLPDGFDRTMAELSSDEKNAISHRRLAVDAWLDAKSAVT